MKYVKIVTFIFLSIILALTLFGEPTDKGTIPLEDIGVINSIFPPTESIRALVFQGSDFSIKNQVVSSEFLIVIMATFFALAITSGLLGDTHLLKRPVSTSVFIGMLAGVITGTLFGPIIGIYSGQIIGLVAGTISVIFSRINIIIVLMSGFTGWYAGLFAGLFAGVPDGINDLTTLQWIGFCIIIIEIEYAIVFYRRQQEKKKLLAIP